MERPPGSLRVGLAGSTLLPQPMSRDSRRATPLARIHGCHSGVALGAQHKWRDDGAEPRTQRPRPPATLLLRTDLGARTDSAAPSTAAVFGHSLFNPA